VSAPIVATTPRDKILNDVFTTALEGGIGYWSTCSAYKWSDGDGNPIREFSATITTEEGDTFTITREVIARGIRLAYERYGKGENGYQARALRALHFGKYDEADYDADTADWIVQMGLGLTSKDGGPMYG
jgi:hypothetical protein